MRWQHWLCHWNSQLSAPHLRHLLRYFSSSSSSSSSSSRRETRASFDKSSVRPRRPSLGRANEAAWAELALVNYLHVRPFPSFLHSSPSLLLPCWEGGTGWYDDPHNYSQGIIACLLGISYDELCANYNTYSITKNFKWAPRPNLATYPVVHPVFQHIPLSLKPRIWL